LISDKDVRKIASLSRVHLREEEIQPLRKDLQDILNYIKKLEKLDTSKIEATSHVLQIKNVYRKDQVIPPLKQKDALSFSIDQYQGSFKVPKVIE